MLPQSLEINTAADLTRIIGARRNAMPLNELAELLEALAGSSNPVCAASRSMLWNELGLVRIGLHDLAGAEQSFETAHGIDQSGRAAYNLAKLAMHNGEFELALQRFKTILAHCPADFSALFNSGICHVRLNDADKALSCFVRAAESEPGNQQVNFWVGECLLQLERADEALPYFKIAYEINSDHFEAAQGYAIALVTSGHYERAIKVCDHSLANCGAALLPLQVKGDALLALGRIEAALKCHAAMAGLDFDARDYIYARLKRLQEENPAAAAEYRCLVNEKYEELAGLVPAVQEEGKGESLH